MPFEIDQEKLDDPSMKVLDIGHPPTKNISYQEYPKMVYLHPKDKTAEQRTRVVNSPDEMEDALSKGWRITAHVPQPKPDASLEGFELNDYESPEPEKRGPGRPKST